MNWELIREILRRAEIKAKARGVKEPTAYIRLASDECWRIYIINDSGRDEQVDGGKGEEAFSNLLTELRSK